MKFSVLIAYGRLREQARSIRDGVVLAEIGGADISNVRGLTAEELRDACSAILGADRIKVVPGWYNETLPTLSTDLRFALVSIDCDLYESTASVLDYLLGEQTYSDGCAVFFDDWYCNRGSPDFGEQKAWADCTAKYKVRFTDWGPYAIVGRKFILHR